MNDQAFGATTSMEASREHVAEARHHAQMRAMQGALATAVVAGLLAFAGALAGQPAGSAGTLILFGVLTVLVSVAGQYIGWYHEAKRRAHLAMAAAALRTSGAEVPDVPGRVFSLFAVLGIVAGVALTHWAARQGGYDAGIFLALIAIVFGVLMIFRLCDSVDHA